MRKKTILFVCTGNLCRSPMAAGILKYLIKEAGGTEIIIDSAGTYGCKGEPATPQAINVCREHGVDISDHLAKKIEYELIKKSDLIVVMEMYHFQEIVRICPEKKDEVVLLGSLEEGDRIDSIPDPFGKGIKEYRACYDQLKRLVGKLYQTVIDPKISLPTRNGIPKGNLHKSITHETKSE